PAFRVRASAGGGRSAPVPAAARLPAARRPAGRQQHLRRARAAALNVRRDAKVIKSLRSDLEKSRAALEEAQTALDARGADLTTEQARARRAEEAEAKALAMVEEERSRADDALRSLPPPPEA